MYKNGILKVAGALAVALAGTVSQSSSLAAQQDRGWLGIDVMCSDCEIESHAGGVVWSFSEAPVVNQMMPGSPAATSGLLVGDILLRIDGIDLTTAEGGRRFGELSVGVPVAFVIRRGGKERTVRVTPLRHADVFDDWHELVMHQVGDWDSMRVQLEAASKEQMKLQRALRDAEVALRRVEMTQTTEDERRLAGRLRSQLDSVQREVRVAQARLKLQADSLAMRTLLIQPLAGERRDELIIAEGDTVPIPDGRAMIADFYPNAVAGARFEPMTQALGEYFEGSKGKGLLLLDVVEGTPAYEAGLREGDVVLSVNGKKVSTVDELRAALKKAADEAEVVYVRKGEKKKGTISSK